MKLKAEYEGILNLFGYSIDCAILDNGKRVLENICLETFFGNLSKLPNIPYPPYVYQDFLKLYSNHSLKDNTKKLISWISKDNQLKSGIYAENLSNIIETWLLASQNEKLEPSIKLIADRVAKLNRCLIIVGIFPLIDDACKPLVKLNYSKTFQNFEQIDNNSEFNISEIVKIIKK